MIVSTPREALWQFINTRLQTPWSEDFRAVGSVKDDCLQGVIAYNGFTGRMCVMHGAIDDPSMITRTFLRAMFDYPFNYCGCEYMITTVHTSNEHSMLQNKRLGFKEVFRFVGAGLNNDDIALFQLRKEDCFWIKEDTHGQEFAPATGLRRGSRGHRRRQQGSHPGTDLRQSAECLHPVG